MISQDAKKVIDVSIPGQQFNSSQESSTLIFGALGIGLVLLLILFTFISRSKAKKKALKFLYNHGDSLPVIVDSIKRDLAVIKEEHNRIKADKKVSPVSEGGLDVQNLLVDGHNKSTEISHESIALKKKHYWTCCRFRSLSAARYPTTF